RGGKVKYPTLLIVAGIGAAVAGGFLLYDLSDGQLFDDGWGMWDDGTPTGAESVSDAKSAIDLLRAADTNSDEYDRHMREVLSQDDSGIELLIDHVVDDNDWNCRSALIRMGRDAVAPLGKAYKTSDSKERRIEIIRILGAIGVRECCPILIRALKDGENNVQFEALEALGNIGEEEAVKPIIALIDAEAGRELAESNKPVAAEKTEDLYAPTRETQYDLITYGYEALSAIGGDNALEYLLSRLDSDNRFHIKEALLEAIRSMGYGAKKAIPKIKRLKDRMLAFESEIKDDLHPAAFFANPGPFETLVYMRLWDLCQFVLEDLEESEPELLSPWTGEAIAKIPKGQKQKIARWIRELGSESSSVSKAARGNLARAGEPAMHMLVKAALYNNWIPARQRVVAEALGSLGQPAIDMLIDTLFLEDEGLSRRVVDVLGMIGRPAARPLSVVLDWRIEWVTADGARSLDDVEKWTRHDMVRTLGIIGDECAVPVLIKSLYDPEAPVSKASVVALGRIHSSTRDASIRKQISEEITMASEVGDPYFRKVADMATRRLKRLEAGFGPGQTVLFARDVCYAARTSCGNQLRKMEQGEAVDLLIQALAFEDDRFAEAAASAFGMLDYPQSTELLLNALELERRTRIRRLIVRSLGEMRSLSEKGIETVANVLEDLSEDDESSFVRKEAETALIKVRQMKDSRDSQTPTKEGVSGKITDALHNWSDAVIFRIILQENLREHKELVDIGLLMDILGDAEADPFK
ncbi:HEAT repeat domain-containing protein, partial [Candidatus Omnitrophota bacterium]